LSDVFVTKSLKYNIRTENNIPNFNTVRYGKHSIRYFRPYLWSKLLKEIRNITSRIRKTNIAELVIILTVRIAIYATLNLFLVLAFLYKAIHSYHTFYRSNLHHYIYNLKHFISVFVFIVS